jgi:rhamnose transport system permease protein
MMGRYKRECWVAAALGVLLLVLARYAPEFFAYRNLRDILVENAPVLVAAVGMTLVILSRNIDISIGAQVAVCGTIAGLVAEAGWPVPMAAGAALLAGAGLGAVNGALVAGLNLPSIVVTLATWVVLRESLSWARSGELVRNLPADFQWFGTGQSTGQWLVVAIAMAVFLAFAWSLPYLAAGRAVYATGSDQEAARLAGIRPRRVVFGVFVSMGALSGLVALLIAVRFPQVDPRMGTGLELRTIAAVVVGGVAISGGRGTLIGTLIGVALLGTVKPALGFMHTDVHWEIAIQGMIILLAVASDAWGRRIS